MLTLRESTRQNPSVFQCSCGNWSPLAVLHRDGLEIVCECGKTYFIRKPNVQNCCMVPENPPAD